MTAHLPEFDDLHRDEEGDGHKVGVQDPEGDKEDEGVGSSVLKVALHIGVHGQLVPGPASMIAPDVGSHSAEHAHGQLQNDDEANLKIQEVVVRACAADDADELLMA